MINSTSKTDNILRQEAIAGRPTQSRPTAPRTSDADNMRASGKATLQAALDAHPEVRPEVVARAQQLAVDGNYPPKEIIRRLSEMLLQSKDLSA